MTQKTIVTICSSCNAKYKLAASAAGSRITCKKCGKSFKADATMDFSGIPLVARLAVTYKVITESQLKVAMTIKKNIEAAGQIPDMEQILIGNLMVPQRLMDLLHATCEFWQAHQMDKRFGAIAVNNGFASREDVDKAIASQTREFRETRTSRKLGDILIEAGLITPEQKAQILQEQERLKENADKLAEKEEEILAASRHSDENQAGESQEANTAQEVDSQPPVADANTAQEVDSQPPVADANAGQEADAQPPVADANAGQSADTPDTEDETIISRIPDREIDIESGFILAITQGGTLAQVIPKVGWTKAMSLEQIQDILFDHDITTGIADDSVIEGFIKYNIGKKTPLKLAEGRPPRPGQNGYITYHFELEHLKVGTLTQDGAIDFKERGEIPVVKSGDLLAEQVPMVPGEPGIDVHGQPIPIPDIRQITLRCGPGAELSEDGMRAFAKIEGQPLATLGGKVSVSQEIVIQGDVDFKTGHIDFEGRIVVEGTVQSGFKVNGTRLTAKEVLAAQIDVEGDVNVLGPVIGAKIKARGRVVAHYFQNSEISAYGDVIAVKEIMDSKIETSGICHVKSGKIVSSVVTAKKGIETLEVGTEVSGPCTLRPGLDDHTRGQMDRLEEKIQALRAEQKKLDAMDRALEKKKEETHRTIADLAQVQDKASVALRAVTEKKEKYAQKGETDQLDRSLAVLDELDQKIKSVDELINKQFDIQDRQETQTQKLQTKHEVLEAKIRELDDEKYGIAQWSRSEKPVAIIKVRKTIHAGTKLVTPHTTRIMEKSFKNVMLAEMRTPLDDGTVKWDIRVHAKK